ncbi:hypothetical protein SDC9_109709 [bioreactor metagenome]|uniref:Uncharacterized protein n=1 Tax=bioreactor metagenome TaxID=1076179 RepID=A0A645BDW6_9ZZZZ
MVRLGQAGDQCFPQPGHGVHRGVGADTGERVGGEHHAADHGRDQCLDHDSQAEAVLGDAVAEPVTDRPRGPQARPAVDHGAHQLVGAEHVEVGLLLAGERQVGQVLGRRGGPYGQGDLPRSGRACGDQPRGRCCGEDGVADLVRHPSGGEGRPDGRAGPFRSGGIGRVDPLESRGDHRAQAVSGDVGGVGRRGDHETTRHRISRPGQPDEIEALATDRRQGGIRVLEGHRESCHGTSIPPLRPAFPGNRSGVDGAPCRHTPQGYSDCCWRDTPKGYL